MAINYNRRKSATGPNTPSPVAERGTGGDVPDLQSPRLTLMWKLAVALLAFASTPRVDVTPSLRETQEISSPVIGRWDIHIAAAGKTLPSWLEVRPSGNGYLVGQFVGVVGMARPISRIEFANGVMRFAIPPQWEQGKADLLVEGRLQGDEMSGTMTFPDGTRSDWTAKRAPSLRRTTMPKWGAPVRLFNGTDLTGWHALGTNQWRAVNGVLQSPRSGANLVTDGTYTDYKLHVEFRYRCRP